jgi:hypothetical protein
MVNNKPEIVSHISTHWLDRTLQLIPFMPEDNDIDSDVLNYLNEDLEEILSLSYKQFWSHVVYEPSLAKFLDMYDFFISVYLTVRYLRYCRREYDAMKFKEVPRTESQQALFWRVFRLFVRLATTRESKSDFISVDYYCKIVFDSGE